MGVLIAAILGLASVATNTAVPHSEPVPAISRAAIPPVIVVEVPRWYAVTGSNLAELRSQLALERLPEESGGSHGRTRSQIEVRYEVGMQNGSCRLTTAEVTLQIITTLPEWKPDKRLAASLIQRWESSFQTLVRHEAVHASHAREAADEVREDLLGLGHRARCKDVEWAVEKILRRASIRLDLKGKRFDARTDFGRLDGSAF